MIFREGQLLSPLRALHGRPGEAEWRELVREADLARLLERFPAALQLAPDTHP